MLYTETARAVGLGRGTLPYGRGSENETARAGWGHRGKVINRSLTAAARLHCGTARGRVS